MLKEWLEGIKLGGRVGLWNMIDSQVVGSETYGLFEADYYGDETPLIVTRIPHIPERQTRKLKNGKVVIFIPKEEEVCETYDDIETALKDNDIIKED